MRRGANDAERRQRPSLALQAWSLPSAVFNISHIVLSSLAEAEIDQHIVQCTVVHLQRSSTAYCDWKCYKRADEKCFPRDGTSADM